jgi:DNA polymerase type B, organellar and viral
LDINSKYYEVIPLKKGYPFIEYIDTLYNLRLEYSKSNPLNYIAKLLLNSLYGRFGMNDSFSEISIMDQKSYQKFENNHAQDIISWLGLDDKVLVEHRNKSKDINTLLDSGKGYETHNTNIAIAAAITAYARIVMSQFKNNPDLILYYSDTDSVFINKPLPDYLVDNKILGLMKLENVLTKAIFLSPKVYCLLTEDNKLIYKVKGLKHEIELTMNDFEQLVYKENLLQKFKTKWFKDLSEGQILVKNQLYTLQVTDNKRKLIYNENKNLKFEFYEILFLKV